MYFVSEHLHIQKIKVQFFTGNLFKGFYGWLLVHIRIYTVVKLDRFAGF